MTRIFIALLFVFTLVACGGGPTYTTQTQQVDGLAIGFEHPTQAILLQNYELFVTLADGSGRPIEGADVSLKLDMPAMPMGANQPVAEPEGNGRYRVNTAYSMEGDWVITVEARAEGKTYTAVFGQTVVTQ